MVSFDATQLAELKRLIDLLVVINVNHIQPVGLVQACRSLG
jgi:hypothetical protein